MSTQLMVANSFASAVPFCLEELRKCFETNGVEIIDESQIPGEVLSGVYKCDDEIAHLSVGWVAPTGWQG